jgi:Tol biopolymer transport system component
MRPLVALAAAALAACSDPPAPGSPAPDGERPRAAVELLVARVARGGERSFYTMAPDGSAVSERGGFPADAFLLTPSPDGRTVAYLRPTDGFVHAWLMDREGGARRPLVEGELAVASLAWSSDGSRLALHATALAGGADDVYVVNADGTGLENLTPDPLPGIVVDRDPSWSPDGRRIAFSSNRSGQTRLWVMDADGSGAAQVADASVERSERRPAWSPDGALIAFVAAGAEGAGVGVVRPDGGGYRVFPARGVQNRIAWSPDGRLLHATIETVDLDVWALDLASGARTDLTRHRDHDLEAVPLRHVPLAPWRGLAAAAHVGGGAADARALAAGDFVTDGRPDVAILAPATEAVRLLAGDAAGLRPVGSLDAGPGAHALGVGDVSGDGLPDVVALQPGGFSAWRGGPEGTGVPSLHPLAGETRALVLADLAGRGTADVVTLHDRPGAPFHVSVHAAGPDGALVHVLDGATEFRSPVAACAADATGEGYLDLVVVADDAATPLLLLPGHGGGGFAPPLRAAPAGFPASPAAAAACADLDGDRRSDLALLRPGAAGLAVLRSRGDAFEAIAPPAVAGAALAAADLDRDGDVDLVAAGPERAEVIFLRNLGDGRLAAPVAFAAGGAPRALAAADLDGDGWADLAVALADGRVAVLRNLGR